MNGRILLIVSHPDDEAMFFSPFLSSMASKRMSKNINVLCIHPGSVKTKMNPGGDISTSQSSQQIINICSENNFKYNGKFIDINKKILEW